MKQKRPSTFIQKYDQLLANRQNNWSLDYSQMHDYQHLAEDFAYDKLYAALFIDMGLGKTVIMLTAFLRLWIDGEVNRLLIVAPLKVANNTWPTEIQTWSHLYALRHSLVTGSAEERLRALRSSAPIHIINRENIPWLVDHFKGKWPYDMVVIDESSSFKDHSSQRFKALKKVRNLIKRFYELTASPVAEGYEGLFAQIWLLDKGERLGSHITHYRQKYFNHNVYSRRYTVKKGMEKEIIAKISDITLEMKADQYLPSRGVQDIIRTVTLQPAERKLYTQMEEDFIIEVLNEMGEEHVIEAQNAGVLSGKLLQMASGVIYRNWVELKPGTEDQVVRCKEAIPLHDHKIEALEAIVEELDGEPLIICYWFQSSLWRLKAAFKNLVVMDRNGSQVPDWNKRKITLLAVHPQSAGHGLNLQKGGRNMCFFDLPSSLDQYEQVRARIDRQGQEHLCRFFHLLAAKTADEHVYKRLQEKKDVQEWFYRRLRKYHERLKAKYEAATIG